MKLGASVLATVRGMAGAALITVASAGCATTPTAEVAQTPAAVDPPPPVEAEQPPNDPDYAAACGRG